MMLSDGVIGQMMEKVQLSDPKPRRTDEELIRECPWATTGKPKSRERNIGWRIDYFLVSDILQPRIKAAEIHSSILGSDHCPVELDIEI